MSTDSTSCSAHRYVRSNHMSIMITLDDRFSVCWRMTFSIMAHLSSNCRWHSKPWSPVATSRKIASEWIDGTIFVNVRLVRPDQLAFDITNFIRIVAFELNGTLNAVLCNYPLMLLVSLEIIDAT